MKKLLYIILFVPFALFGQENYSLSFDGVDDYIDFGVPQNFFEDTFVISVVFKPEEFNTNFSCLASRWNNCGQQSWWFGIAQGRRLHFGSNGDDIYYSNENMFQYSDAWIHYSVVRIGNQAKFYLDGVLFDNEINFFTDNNSYELEKLLIGAKNNADDNCSPNGNSIFPDFFNGKIYNLNIWDVALNVDEIQFFMNCPPTGNEEHLVGYWNFNEGSGDTVYDISGNGNNGTIHGASYSDDVPDNTCIEGCIDENAFNYNSSAHTDNGSCEYLGCMNSHAINFDETATIDDEESCIYSQEYVHGLWNEVDDGAIEFNDYQEQATTSLSSLQQALDTWNTSIDLSAGWNMFGYGCPSSINVTDGLSNHTESIIITKDNSGNVYMPEFGFNGIGDFTPGYGYQIKLTEAIEGFSLCDWYVNDIPEDNIVSLQEENANLAEENISLQEELDCYENPQVGDYCFGGIVFYIDEAGKYGLVASSQDIGQFQWGCNGINVNGADALNIGGGYQNTIDILNQNCTTINGGITAAQAADNIVIDNFSDWFLPSINELIQIYNNIGVPLDLNGFEAEWYWSSTELNPSSGNLHAYYHAFNDNVTGHTGKHGPLDGPGGRVRPIRAFGTWTMGCMDSLACNFNRYANMADGSCEFANEGYDCDGNLTVQVGDDFQGGILFYIDSTGQHGLVAAHEDLDGEYEWGCYMISTGITDTYLGAGYQNTLEIVAQNCEAQNGNITAAQATLNYNYIGFNDWFLPSRDELQQLHILVSLELLTPIEYGYYLSSTELDSSTAADVHLGGSNSSGGISKTNSASGIRPIRSF